MAEETTKGPAQLPEYESPVAISLTKMRSGIGQNPDCLSGQRAGLQCNTGYSAITTCAPTGLGAGGTCNTGDGGLGT